MTPTTTVTVEVTQEDIMNNPIKNPENEHSLKCGHCGWRGTLSECGRDLNNTLSCPDCRSIEFYGISLPTACLAADTGEKL